MFWMLWIPFVALAADSDVLYMQGSGSSVASPVIVQTLGLIESRLGHITKFSYRSVGSGTGRTEIQASPEVVDFACSDTPLPQSVWDNAAAAGRTIVQLPMYVGALGFTYNIPDLMYKVNMTACVAVQIIQRDITLWNDERVLSLNPGLQKLVQQNPLRDWRIIVMRRDGSRASGSTTNLFDYFNTVTPLRCPGALTIYNVSTGDIAWPDDTLAFSEEEDLGQAVLTTPMSFGYVSVGLGKSLLLPFTYLDNRDGYLVNPYDATFNLSTVMANPDALFPAAATESWANVDFNFLPGQNAWPIVFTTYLMVVQNSSRFDNETLPTLRAILKTLYSAEGGQLVESFAFTRLPPAAVSYNLLNIERFISGPDLVVENGALPILGAADLALSTNRQTPQTLLNTLLQRDVSQQINELSNLRDMLLDQISVLNSTLRAEINLKAAKTSNSLATSPAFIIAVVAIILHGFSISINLFYNIRTLSESKVVVDEAALKEGKEGQAAASVAGGPGYLIQGSIRDRQH